MIDLSYLTEEEQERILTVLKRDEELKRAEENRVRQLQRETYEEERLKYLTGEWFYEAKSLRHTDRIHGSQIILASMKQQKPVTLADLYRARGVVPSAVDSYVPPNHSDVPEEQPPQPQEDRNLVSSEVQNDIRKIQSPARQRHNPFDRENVVLDTSGEIDRWLTNAAPEQLKTSETEMSSLNSHVASPVSAVSEGSETSLRSPVAPAPVPKKRTILPRSKNSCSDSDSTMSGRGDTVGPRVISPTPRGILKRSLSNKQGSMDVQSLHPTQDSTATGMPKEPENTLHRVKTEADPDRALNRDLVRVSPTLGDAERKLPAQDETQFDAISKGPVISQISLGNDDITQRMPDYEENSGEAIGNTFRERSNVPLPMLSPQVPIKKPTSAEMRAYKDQSANQTFFATHETQASDREIDMKKGKATKQECFSPCIDDQRVHLEFQDYRDICIPPSPEVPSKPKHNRKGSPRKPPSKPAALSPKSTSEEGDSIAKVLEWFSRSSDSGDWSGTETSPHEEIITPKELGVIEDKVYQKDNAAEDGHSVSSPQRETKGPDINNMYGEDEQRMGADFFSNPVQMDAEDEVFHFNLHEIQPAPNLSLNAQKAYQPKRRISEAERQNTSDGKEIKHLPNKEEARAPILPASAGGVEVPPQEIKETQKISHLTSFWEKGNTGPKILISRSNKNTDDRHRTFNSANGRVKERELVGEANESDQTTGYNSKENSSPPYAEEIHGNYLNGMKQNQELILSSTDEHGDIRESSSKEEDVQLHLHPQDKELPKGKLPHSKKIAATPATEANSQLASEHQNGALMKHTQMNTPLQKGHAGTDLSSVNREEDPMQEKIFRTRQNTQPETTSLSGHSTVPETKPRGKDRPMLETSSLSMHSPEPEATSPSKHCSQLEATSLSSYSLEPDSSQFQHSPEPETVVLSSPTHNLKRVPPRPEIKTNKIKHLKSFWEMENSRPNVYVGKQTGLVDTYANRSPDFSSAKLNKRFTKSEFDLTKIDSEYNTQDSEGLLFSPDKQRPNFIVLNMKQRLETSSTGQGGNSSQFKDLRNFWDGLPSNQSGAKSPTDTNLHKPKSPQTVEPINTLKQEGQAFTVESKPFLNPNYYPKSSEKVHDKTLSDKSTPPSLSCSSKTQIDAGVGGGPVIDKEDNQSHQFQSEDYSTSPVLQSQRGLDQNSLSETNSSISQSTMGKQSQPQQDRRTNTRTLNGPAKPLRRATSMYTLALNEEELQGIPSQLNNTQEVSLITPKKTQESRNMPSKNKQEGTPVKSNKKQEDTLMPSKKTWEFSQRVRHNINSAPDERIPSGSPESESHQLRARSFVPRDVQHYLGITEKASIPFALKQEEMDGEVKSSTNKSISAEMDLSGPYETIAPRGPGNQTGQRPLCSNHGSIDTGRESPRSSTSESWSQSWTSSTRDGDDDEDLNPVQKALRRAALRPAFTKSLEDITSPSATVSSVPSPSSTSFSDPDHVKNMSKSVPSFLQKEGDGRDSDSASEDSFSVGKQMMDNSLTNSISSGMVSLSSVSGSVRSVYSGDFGSVEVQGNIQFTINYLQKLREFHIFVVQCTNLAAVDPKRSRSDPYVKSYLVPDKSILGKRKTSVKKKTLNPIFKELLRYRVRMEYLRTQTLNLSVWHHDTFGRNCFLGEVDVDLSNWDFDNTQMNNLPLNGRPNSGFQTSEYRGEMKLAVRFLPQLSHSKGTSSSGEVHIWVKECKNLPLIRGVTLDPYVKCFVLPDTSRKSRQKTRVMKRTANPVFNHTMVYDGFREEDLREACLELTVWDRDRRGNHLLGGLRLGLGTGKSYGEVVDWMDSTDKEVSLWERVMDSPNAWVDIVLPLRMIRSTKTV